MALTLSATGPLPVEQVWDDYVRPRRWSSWAPQIRTVDCADEVIEPGSEGVVHPWPTGRLGFTIVAVDHDRRTWSWRVGPRGLVLLEHGVKTDEGGTTAWARVHLPRVVALSYGPLAWIALARLVRRVPRGS